ncbi:MAG: carboxypeptidase, partial [Alphaproteobacteria bacterium HGW-Alphaproteobacteria-16]
MQQAIIDKLSDWLKLECPTHDAAAVNAMHDLILRDVVDAPVAVERIPGRDGLGDTVLLRAGPEQDRDGIFIITHVDTVHPIGTATGPLPVRQEGDRLYGPGSYDMKGGILVALLAMLDAARAGRIGRPVTFLLSPDEEIGSPTTRALVEEIGRRSSHALVMEPARPGGAAVTARKGV